MGTHDGYCPHPMESLVLPSRSFYGLVMHAVLVIAWSQLHEVAAAPVRPGSPVSASTTQAFRSTPRPPSATITTPPSTASATAATRSSYSLLPKPSNVVGVHLVLLPGTNSFLFMERASAVRPDRSRQIAGSLDLDTMVWTHIEAPDGLFCSGHTLTADGKVIVVGGHKENAGWPSGLGSVRLYSRLNKPLEIEKVGNMSYRRWYPSATLLPGGKVIIMGGTQGVGAGTSRNAYYEIWDPRGGFPLPLRKIEENYLRSIKTNFYPFNYVMPTGDMFNYCGRSGWIMDAEKGEYKVRIPPLSGYATMQFPFTGTSVLLGLYPQKNYQFEVMVFGGNTEDASDDGAQEAGKLSYRIRVNYGAAAAGSYSFSDWQEEDMVFRRVMGDATLLPNGYVILLNGAQRGLAGDSASNARNRASYPVFTAVMYNPDGPVGSRYTVLASSTIARMYHSTAGLTMDGTILVSGCDPCFKVITDVRNYEPLRGKFEYRNEIFYPPFWYEPNKPTIVRVNGMSGLDNQIPSIRVGQTFNVTFSLPSNFSASAISAVLMAPSSTTHSFNMNQRLVGLRVVSVNTTSRTLILQAPPTANHAPPQLYMLFLLNGKTYGRAKWVHIKP